MRFIRASFTKVHFFHKQLHYEGAVLQCQHLQIHRWYSAADLTQVVVSVSHRSADCWRFLLIVAIPPRIDDRIMLGSLAEI